ncbi:MAG TPA: hypothetical protein VM146_10410, partial [Steroidobacteraceae bacterium]|nr:hypothetical protein [Steroidobacteraceae bacterium]
MKSLQNLLACLALWVPVALLAAPIDRQALVTRHNPTITAVDPSAPLMVGNGSIAFTADITGLQTFQGQYSPLVPLLTQAQWAWHSFPNPKGFRLEDALVPMKVRGGTRKYPALTSWDQAQAENIRWLRENPHRFNLGRVGLHLAHADGSFATFKDIGEPRQTLDLWTGRLLSRFVFDGVPVEVETSVHPQRDIIIVRLRTALLSDGRAGVDLRFPGVGRNLNPDPSDWTNAGTHSTQEVTRDDGGLLLGRTLDDTHYSVRVASDRELDIAAPAVHQYRLTAPGATQLTLLVEFTPQAQSARLPLAELAREAAAAWWESYWKNGGVVDFTGSRDARANELERRIVLSQYLSALNGA